MPAPKVITGFVYEFNAVTCLARIVGNDGTNITQASLTGISCAVYGLGSANPDVAVATPTVTVSVAVFDTLQTNVIWTTDTTGYNFKHTVAAGADSDTEPFALGNRPYRIEYLFDPTSGEDFFVVFGPETVNTRT